MTPAEPRTSSRHEPYYSLISNELRSRILSGDIKIGDKLPSETELAAEYSVSRMTARHAITELVDQHLVERMQGRGAFVIGDKIERRMRAFTAFHEDMLARGLHPGSRTISREVRRCTPHEARLLAIRPHEDVLVVTRVRSLEGAELGWQRIVIAPDLIDDVQGLNLDETSFYAFLRETGRPIARAHQKVEAVLDASVAEQIGAPESTPFLRFEKVSYREGDIPVELLTSVFRGDRFAFDMDLAE